MQETIFGNVNVNAEKFQMLKVMNCEMANQNLADVIKKKLQAKHTKSMVLPEQDYTEFITK